jgi:hypothetical protein
MKRYVIWIAVLMCVADTVWAQPKETYHAKILFQGIFGAAPGEYGFNVGGGGQEYPTMFTVDGKEQVYVLDDLNNRIEHYDADGKFLGLIPIPSSAPATKMQKEHLPGAERSVWIGGLTFIGETLYVVQEVASGMARKPPTFHVLKLQGNQFVYVETPAEKNKALKAMSYGERRGAKIRVLFAHDPKFQLSGRLNTPVYDGFTIGDVVIDQDGNRWLINSGGGCRKYSPNGVLLFEVKAGNDLGVVSRQGDYFSLSPYSDVSSKTTGLPAGIQITKYSLK